jgi:hypothetical protein
MSDFSLEIKVRAQKAVLVIINCAFGKFLEWSPTGGAITLPVSETYNPVQQLMTRRGITIGLVSGDHVLLRDVAK